MTERKADRWYYSFLPFNVAGGSTSPLIPLFVTEGLAGNVAQVGIISAISSLASVPANIIWGNLSDTLKKRKIFVLIGFIGLAIPLLLMGLSTDIQTYYLTSIADHFAEGIAERRCDHQDRKHFEEIRERGWILERMR